MKTHQLDAVLAVFGDTCGCQGACGRQHGECPPTTLPSVAICGAPAGTGRTGTGRCAIAPYPPRASDRENAEVELTPETARPWCSGCWTLAVRLVQAEAAKEREREAAEAQPALFDA